MTGERIADTPDEESVCEGEGDSGEAVLVWNGMVASIHRIPLPDAPATTPTRPAEAAEPVRPRPTA